MERDGQDRELLMAVEDGAERDGNRGFMLSQVDVLGM